MPKRADVYTRDTDTQTHDPLSLDKTCAAGKVAHALGMG